MNNYLQCQVAISEPIKEVRCSLQYNISMYKVGNKRMKFDIGRRYGGTNTRFEIMFLYYSLQRPHYNHNCFF